MSLYMMSNVIQIKMAVGDSDTVHESDVLSSILANFTHAFDKEIIAWMYNNTDLDLLTVHDSVGTHLADVTTLYQKTREAYNAVINPDSFEDALAQNVGKDEAKRLRKELAPEDYKPEYVFQNQHNFGKSGKYDADSELKDIWDRVGGVPEGSLLQRSDGLVTADMRKDRVIFQQSEGLEEKLQHIEDTSERITEDSTQRAHEYRKIDT